MRTVNIKVLKAFLRSLVILTLFVTAGKIFAQTEVPPTPSAPKTVSIPAVKEKKLKNGMTVAVVERTSVPLVTVQLLVPAGAALEPAEKAGLADLTATMLTKGTKSRNATQIAEDMDFLGASLDTGAGWNNSTVSVTVTPDKLEQAMAIMADLVLNPKFDQKELDLLKSQTLDGLNYNLKQPSFLANYVATKFSFGEHPAAGTPASVSSISTADVASFHSKYYLPNGAVMIFAGDITADRAASLTDKTFGSWKSAAGAVTSSANATGNGDVKQTGRLLVVDLPNSGQAAVSYYKPIASVGRGSGNYYSASVMNSVLGGGYSSRLNQEIRIKRGLSYGAGSSFAWRSDRSNFSTRAQTKNESAAQVAELTLEEVKKLTSGSVASDELVPRKSVLTGNFGRNLETTSGLANAIAELYSFGIPTSELNKYMSNVNAINDVQIRDFAGKTLLGGDFIIVGDYSIFKDDLAKRFPELKVQVIKAADLDLSQDDLTK